MFYNTYLKGNCVYPFLNNFTEGKIREFNFAPNELPDIVVKRVIDKICKSINYQQDDLICIESNYDIVSFWAELVAKEISAKHICFCCNEVFTGYRKKYHDFIDFFKFKYDRNELLGISKDSMHLLFGDLFPLLKSDDSHFFVAAADESVQDVQYDIVNEIVKKDINIAYIGRANKGNFDDIVYSVMKFVRSVSSKTVLFVVVGDFNSKQRTNINQKFKNEKNLTILFTGSLVPLPVSLFRLLDVCIACSGCAIASAQQNVPTILIDAIDGLSNGILGYDTNDLLFREDGKKGEQIEDTLYNLLVKNKYLGKKNSFTYNVNRNLIYKNHLLLFDQKIEQVYYTDKLKSPKNITVFIILKFLYLKFIKIDKVV